jgi:hypothetical protein
VRGGLARYVLAATLARVSDGGAIVAVVLLVNSGQAWSRCWPVQRRHASPDLPLPLGR